MQKTMGGAALVATRLPQGSQPEFPLKGTLNEDDVIVYGYVIFTLQCIRAVTT